MKKISSMFTLLFMITALAIPLFPLDAEEDCCCGDGCLCEAGEPMSCETEINTCDQIPVLPIPAAPLNKVVVGELDDQNSQPVIINDTSDDQVLTFELVLSHSKSPQPGYHLPLLI